MPDVNGQHEAGSRPPEVDDRGRRDGHADGAGADRGGRSTVRATDRAIGLLLAVVEGLDTPGGRTLTELADALDLAPSTTSRQLASLEAAALVERHDGSYGPGPALVRLAHRVVGRHPLPVLAQPVLDEVAASTGETCVLAVPHDEDRALYVAAADGTHTLRVTGWLGRDVPREGSAVGRALADAVPAGEVAVGRDTVEDGVTGISTAVRDRAGAVVAAVSVLGPDSRLDGHPLRTASAAVVAAAATIERLLGT